MAAEPVTVYMSAGSNLGDRAANLRHATEVLGNRHITIRRMSSIYETEPVGYPCQPWFLNMAFEFETDLTPLRLLSVCQEIERSMGRSRPFANAPRTMDLDILLYGDRKIAEPVLRIPHPRMAERRFVLAPLADIAADVIHPELGVSIRLLLARCADRSSVVLYTMGGRF